MQEMTVGRTVRASSGIVLIVVATCLMACDPKIDRAKADRLAAAKVQQYAKEEGLKTERFTKPDVREQDGKWLYTYQYPDPPKQSVAVIVFADGRVELSRMLDNAR
jgi:hypothetical protein